MYIIFCAGTIPTALAAKCESDTCTTLTSELNTAKNCLTDYTASTCTAAYGAASAIPTKLNQVHKANLGCRRSKFSF